MNWLYPRKAKFAKRNEPSITVNRSSLSLYCCLSTYEFCESLISQPFVSICCKSLVHIRTTVVEFKTRYLAINPNLYQHPVIFQCLGANALTGSSYQVWQSLLHGDQSRLRSLEKNTYSELLVSVAGFGVCAIPWQEILGCQRRYEFFHMQMLRTEFLGITRYSFDIWCDITTKYSHDIASSVPRPEEHDSQTRLCIRFPRPCLCDHASHNY
jgi:hypothetical protein